MKAKKKLTYTVRGFNHNEEEFDAPTGVIEDKESFLEVVVDSQAEAIVAMLTDQDFRTMCQPYLEVNDTSDLLPKNIINVIDVKIALNSSDKLSVKSVKTSLRTVIMRWAEKCRVKGLRGWRLNAIRSPRFEYNYSYDTTFVYFQVLLTNVAIYSKNENGLLRTKFTSSKDEWLKDVAKLEKELYHQCDLFGALHVTNSRFKD